MSATSTLMRQAGYTLVEMLAALVIISLAMEGLFQAVHVIAGMQASAGRLVQQSRLEAAVGTRLSALLSDQGPFYSDQANAFSGSASQFSFACVGDARCGARIAAVGGQERLEISDGGREISGAALLGANDATFTYVGQRSAGDSWPPVKTDRERLLRVVVLSHRLDGVVPLATANLWKGQPHHCSYDAVALACRSAAP